MRTLFLSLIVAAAALSISGSAGRAEQGLLPGYQAHAQLVFANGYALHHAGCLKWMPFVRSWYNTCGWWEVRPHGPLVVVKY